MFAGLVTLAEAYFLWNAPVIIFGGIVLAAFLPIVYSFLLYKKAVNKMKYVYIVLAVTALVLFGLRMSTPEDTWVCTNGVWIAHGMPSADMPKTPCQ